MRSKLVRLAHERPELRGALVPLLRKTADEREDLEDHHDAVASMLAHVVSLLETMEFKARSLSMTENDKKAPYRSYMRQVKKIRGDLKGLSGQISVWREFLDEV